MPFDVLLTDLAASGGWEPCVRSLRQSNDDLTVFAVVPEAGLANHLRSYAPEVVELVAASPSAALMALRSEDRTATQPDFCLVVCRPVVVPPDLLDGALRIVESDLRMGTVSMLTNDAGYLSFPHRNTPWTHQVENLDEVSLTRRLRSWAPDLLPAPVPLAVGPLTLFAGPALDALGVLPPADTGDELIGAISLATQAKGFLSVVDPTTFYLTPHDSSPRPPSVVDVPETIELGDLGPILAEERLSESTPFALVHQTCRAKALGLRIGIDGTCLGPKEMGTQVQTLQIVRALVDHEGVAEVTVGVRGPLPGYVRAALTHEKVRTVTMVADDMVEMNPVDILHRPFQPVQRVEVESWRKVARRVVVSILDVIAYRIGSYHASGEAWCAYRNAIWSTLAEVDGATVISADVKDQMLMERLPIDTSRTYVVELGTDHVSGIEDERIPTELLERGYVASEFLVVLGASYTHKNRDVAIRTVQRLREGGRDIGLVLVGAAVPHGSSRRLEAAALDPGDAARWLWTIPDVSTAERNWLFRHAGAVLYPTSAEGFGFIPFEAAHFDTPCVCVPFGPLVELTPDLPVAAKSWSPDDLAVAVEAVLSDPALARAQIQAVAAAAGGFTWAATAAKLVTMYRDLLARPGR